MLNGQETKPIELPVINISLAKGGGISDLTLEGDVSVTAKDLARYVFDFQQETKRLYDSVRAPKDPPILG